MEIVKSPNDSREYRPIALPNGLRVLLISDDLKDIKSDSCSKPQFDNENHDDGHDDEDDDDGDDDDGYHEMDTEIRHGDGDECLSSGSDSGDSDSSDSDDGEDYDDFGHRSHKKEGALESAVALCIRVGSFSDPPELPGLAHFLEHMVFMGSQKYPEENSFDAFLSKHGGETNAHTDCEQTLFHFTVRREGLEEALKRFAQFFTSPLLKKSCINREIQAVDSEYFQAKQDDSESLNQLMCHLALEGHPMNKFFWGNEKTLKDNPRKQGIDVRQMLEEFYHKYYSAHFMTLTVVSCDSLDNLERWVKESFSDIPSNGEPSLSFVKEPLPYTPDVFQRLYKVLPTKVVRELHIIWQLPPLMDQYKVKPLQFLGSLVGHEGRGSLLSLLRKRDLALGLLAGNGGSGVEYNTNCSTFSVGLSLTEKGNQQIFECCTLLFQYMKMVQQASLADMTRYYQEMKIVEENEFNYKDKEDPDDYACDIAEAMQVYPVKDYLTGDSLMYEFNEKVISDVVRQLVPEQAVIFWMSKNHTCDEDWSVEPWFETHFKSQGIPQEWLMRWKHLKADENFHFPRPNPFVATVFSLKPPDVPATLLPVVIADNKYFKVWYRKDEHFKIPKAWYCLHMMSPVTYQSAENAVCTDLFLNLLLRNLTEEIYDAECALLEYSIRTARTNTGIVVKVSGLDHKLKNLFDTIMEAMGKFVSSEEAFKAEKEHLKTKYHNALLKPKKLARMHRLNVLEHHCCTTADKFSVVDSVSFGQLIDFARVFRSQLFVESLFQGNITSAEAIQAMEHMRRTIDYSPLDQEAIKKVTIKQLPSNAELLLHQSSFDVSSPNTAIVVYHQFCPGTIKASVMNDLLVQCLDEPFFDSLRTKEQLGYEVRCTCHDTSGVLGISFNVVTQANKFTTEYVTERVNNFVVEADGLLATLGDEDFEKHITAMIAERKEEDVCLEDEVDRNWWEVLSQAYVFDRLQKEVAILKSITKKDLCEWFRMYCGVGDGYRKLCVQISGMEQPSSSREIQENVKLDPAQLKQSLLTDEQVKKIESFFNCDRKDDFLMETHTTCDGPSSPVPTRASDRPMRLTLSPGSVLHLKQNLPCYPPCCVKQ